MRTNVLARTIVSLTAVAGIAAGTLAAAGTSYAAPAPTARTAASAQASILATNNLGLSTTQAKYVQCFLRDAPASYTGGIDGQLGTNSWKAMQRHLRAYWDYNDSIDGDPGPNTIKALPAHAEVRLELHRQHRRHRGSEHQGGVQAVRERLRVHLPLLSPLTVP